MHTDSASSSPSLTRKPRQSLRDYQRELAERTTSARVSAATSFRQLGFFSAGRGWLIDLSEAAEIMPVPAVTAVPGTQPWFLGLINYRGKLTGVVDFECFLGHEPPFQKTSDRLIVLSDRFGVVCSLRVAAVSGLMDLSADLISASHGELAALPDTAVAVRPLWQGPLVRIRDKEWQKLDVQALVTDARFADAALR